MDDHVLDARPLPRIIYALGPPGVGKSTLCTRWAHEWGYIHISMGDVIRKWVQEKNRDHEIISSRMDKGETIPPKSLRLILSLEIQRQIKEHGDEPIILDGFPRTLSQAQNLSLLQAVARQLRKVEVEGRDDVEAMIMPVAVLFFKCTSDRARERFLDRARETSDTEEKWLKRWKSWTYDEVEGEKALWHYYNHIGALLCLVDTNGSQEDNYNGMLRDLARVNFYSKLIKAKPIMYERVRGEAPVMPASTRSTSFPKAKTDGQDAGANQATRSLT